jgi:hypothetical protein
MRVHTFLTQRNHWTLETVLSLHRAAFPGLGTENGGQQVRQTKALALFTVGYALITLLSPLVAFFPAFGAFFAAGLLLDRS